MTIEKASDTDIIKEMEKRGLSDIMDNIILKITGSDQYEKSYKTMLKIFIGTVSIFSFLAITFGIITFSTLHDMKTTYIQETDKVLRIKSEIDKQSNLYSLSYEQRREKFKKDYIEILRQTYFEVSDINKKFTDEQQLLMFDALWTSSEKLKVDFFLTLAYMKAATNFDPNYSENYKYGSPALSLIDYELFSSLTKNDPDFNITYRGSSTASDPIDSVKILISKISSLNKTFNYKNDWVLFALFEDVYSVTTEYWNEGVGRIPEDFYKSGKLYKALGYYYIYSRWDSSFR